MVAFPFATMQFSRCGRIGAAGRLPSRATPDHGTYLYQPRVTLSRNYFPRRAMAMERPAMSATSGAPRSAPYRWGLVALLRCSPDHLHSKCILPILGCQYGHTPASRRWGTASRSTGLLDLSGTPGSTVIAHHRDNRQSWTSRSPTGLGSRFSAKSSWRAAKPCLIL